MITDQASRRERISRVVAFVTLISHAGIIERHEREQDTDDHQQEKAGEAARRPRVEENAHDAANDIGREEYKREGGVPQHRRVRVPLPFRRVARRGYSFLLAGVTPAAAALIAPSAYNMMERCLSDLLHVD